MVRAERFIYLEHVIAENNQLRLAAVEQRAKHERVERGIATAVSMLQVWSAYNIAAMFAYRDPHPKHF